MLTKQNQTRTGKILKCTIFVGYGGLIFFLDSTVLALDYYISMFMIGMNHRFMHAR